MKWLINLLFGSREEPAPEPADEVMVITATPTAGIVKTLQSLGLEGDALVVAIQVVETECAKAVARARAEMNVAAARVHKPVPVTKPQVVTRRSRRPKKRNRANYMRDYRNRLKLVTHDGDAA